ncbi:hypothetical protein U472_04330 [Orenia metallireducens]|jgi:hypothetical protein|uniref:SnoaL-like domain-containing protein n=1 Tax=Orenia metallireducens TaxID=1413210 RepID=A0A1C0ABM7_9FIRM|nr:nuclear transport factor 2 family protein [Orenia metallireducens]OCL27785.1 hypothetical protein U472_04330 [Orenia metallireducens]
MNDQKRDLAISKVNQFLDALKEGDLDGMKSTLHSEEFECLERGEKLADTRKDFIKIFEHEFKAGLELYKIELVDKEISVLDSDNNIKIKGRQVHDVKDPGKTREIQEFIFAYELKNINEEWYINKVIIDDIED